MSIEAAVRNAISTQTLTSLTVAFQNCKDNGLEALQLLIDSDWEEGRRWLIQNCKRNRNWVSSSDPRTVEYNISAIARRNDVELADTLMEELGLVPDRESFLDSVIFSIEKHKQNVLGFLLFGVTPTIEECDHWSQLQDVESIYGLDPITAIKICITHKNKEALRYVIDSMNNRLIYSLDLPAISSVLGDSTTGGTENETEEDEESDEELDFSSITGEECFLAVALIKNETSLLEEASSMVSLNGIDSYLFLLSETVRAKILANQRALGLKE